MTSTQLALSTLRTDVWQMVYNHLQTGTYAISTDNIHGAMNKNLVEDEGYPQVVIERPKVNNMKAVVNNRIMTADISFTIMVYHTGGANVRVLADEVVTSIRTGWRTLNGYGLKNIEFPEGDNDYFQEGAKSTVHVEIINVTARYVGQ